MAEKNYCTSSIKRITTQYGELFSLNLRLEDLQKFAKNGWVSLTMAERKAPSEKGATHYVYQNTFEPKQQTEKKEVQSEDDGLPF